MPVPDRISCRTHIVETLRVWVKNLRSRHNRRIKRCHGCCATSCATALAPPLIECHWLCVSTGYREPTQRAGTQQMTPRKAIPITQLAHARYAVVKKPTIKPLGNKVSLHSVHEKTQQSFAPPQCSRDSSACIRTCTCALMLSRACQRPPFCPSIPASCTAGNARRPPAKACISKRQPADRQTTTNTAQVRIQCTRRM